MSLKYIVPALAIAGRAAAQCSAGASATATIQNQGDASGLQACRTFSGSIAIATDTQNDISLDGIEAITGSLIVNNVTQLTSLSADSLTIIEGSFTLYGLTILTTLSFPALTMVDSIDWSALPALQGLSFTETVQEANSVSIQNTELGSLDGINLQTIDTMILANNPFLTDINMQLGNVSTQMTIESNGRDLDVSFPDMIWANNITIRNASTVSIPSLASVNGSMGFYSCDFESISAPNLTTVGASLSFVSNEALTNVSFPDLKSTGGALNVENNTALEGISFPALTTVRGALDFYGNFSTVEIPNLNLVQGAFNLQSTQDISSACSHFAGLKGSNNVIRGLYTCAGKESKPGGTGTNTGSGSSSSSSSFASPELVPVAGTLLGVAAAIFGIF